MGRRTLILLTTLFLLAGVGLTAQESGQEAGGGLLSPTEYLSLTAADIATADLYQLSDWCRLLGIDHRGTIETVRQRLYRHYGYAAPRVEELPEAQRGQELSIRSADSTRYFTLESKSEGYVEISGGVVLELYSPAEDSRHTIRADKFLYNQATGDISAAGDVRYILASGDEREETFQGENLTVNLNNWESRFLKGFTVQERTVNEKAITFTFYGDAIARSADEIILLKDGLITSSEMEEPSYRIEADEIWVYEQGEWLLNGATFYIGRVPVLVFPFFFQLRDKMVVNPSFGFRLVDGAFLQTTTYLYGARPKSEEASLSFLQLTEEENAAGVTEIRGLYRRSKPNPTPEEIAAARRAAERNEYGRIILDVYNRKGLAAGLELNRGGEGLLKESSLFIGAGLTRVVATVPPYQFTWIDPDETDPRSVWEGAWIGGDYVPLRLMGALTMTGSGGGFEYTLDLPFESDPRIAELFEERRESIDWGELLAITEPPPAESTTLPDGFSWELGTSFRRSAGGLSPWVGEISIREFDSDLNWKYATISGTPTEIEEQLPQYDALPSYLQSAYASRYFVYPESFIAPRLSLVLSGRLWPFPETATGERGDGADRDGDLPAPWDRETLPETAGAPADERELDVPPRLESYAIPLDSDEGGSRTLTYRFNPRLTHGINFDVRRWDDGQDALYTLPGQVDLDPAYTLTTLAGDARLSFNGDYRYKLWSVEESLGLAYQEKQRVRTIDSSIPDYTALLESDKLGSYRRLSHSLVLSNRPFIHAALPVDQLFEYRLRHYLFTRSYESGVGYTSELFPWERETIQEQKLSSRTAWDIEAAEQVLLVSALLPPLLGDISAGYTSTGPRLRLSLSGGVEEVEQDRWEPQDLTASGRWNFNEYSYLRQELLFGENDQAENFRLREGETEAAAAEEENGYGLSSRFEYGINAEDDAGSRRIVLPERLVTRAWLGAFWSAYTMEYLIPVELVIGTGWVAEPERRFIPSEVSFGYKREFEHEPLWKRRIALGYGFDTGYTQDLNRYSDTTFFFKTSLSLSIHRFLDLEFSSLSENTAAFRYLPWLIEGTDIAGVNPAEDLLRSLNIFNLEQRRSSNFNLKSVDLKAVHHLDQWDLTVEYTGEPVQEESGGFPVYRWESNFSIYMQWNPIPELEQEVRFDDGELNF